MIKSHKDLAVYQLSLDLIVDVYKLTHSFPKEELYGLTSQLKRSVVSVSSNIAEGTGRRGKAEFIRFLFIAMGSLSEADTQLIIAQRLSFCVYSSEMVTKVYKIKRMLARLIDELKKEG